MRYERFTIQYYAPVPQCGNLPTGIASKGRSGRYFYYQCQRRCRERFRADQAHEEFRKYISSFKPNSTAIGAFQEYLMDTFQFNQRDGQREADTINAEIARNQKRLQNAKQMRLDIGFDVTGYKDIKASLESAIDNLIRKKATRSSLLEDFGKYVRHAVIIVRDLGSFYAGLKDLAFNDLLLGSIFLILKNIEPQESTKRCV